MGLWKSLLSGLVEKHGFVKPTEVMELRAAISQCRTEFNLFRIDIYNHIDKQLQPLSKRISTQLSREKDIYIPTALEKKSRRIGSSKVN